MPVKKSTGRVKLQSSNTVTKIDDSEKEERINDKNNQVYEINIKPSKVITPEKKSKKKSTKISSELSPKNDNIVNPSLVTPTKNKSSKDKAIDDINYHTNIITPSTSNRIISEVRDISSPIKSSKASLEKIISAENINSQDIKKSNFNSKAVIDPKVKLVYKLIRKSTGTLGGNADGGAIYGELTIGSMQRVIDLLVLKCELNTKSRFIDVGSGLGKPNIHVAQYPGVRVSIGVELIPIRWELGVHNLFRLLKDTADNINNSSNSSRNEPTINRCINFLCSDIDAATTLDPFTHVYMYDLGFPPPLQQSIAAKFNSSKHCKYLISYRSPRRVINEYLYEVELVDQIATSMHGSGEVHTAYLYKRTNLPSDITADDIKINLPRRPIDDEDEEVVCDKLFKNCIELAVGDYDVFYQHISNIARDNMNDARPKRERKPRILSY